MNWDEVKEQLNHVAFPLEEIKGISKEVKGDYVAMRMLGVIPSFSSHVTVTKDKHDCNETTYNTRLEGFPVCYRYKWCGTCEDYFDKCATVFNNEDNVCYTKKYV